MLRVLTPPTSTLLLDPAEVLARLGAGVDDTAAVTRLVRRASAIIARQLRFDPWYQELEETFDGACDTDLNLTGRPFVRLVSIASGTDDPLIVDEDFAIRRPGRPSGEVHLFRRDTWQLLPVLGDPAPDWTVRYFSGWWLPAMSDGEVVQPADVLTLPDDIAEAAWLVCNERWASDGNDPTIASEAKGGIRIDYRTKGTVAGEQRIIPAEASAILEPYLPLGM